MTEPIDEDLERRIVRQLDGELDAAAEESLHRELLRDPAARRLRDECAAADRRAGEALREAFARGGPAGVPAAEPRAATRRRRQTLTAALAAAAALAIGFWPSLRSLLSPGSPPADAVRPGPVHVAGSGGRAQRLLPPDFVGLLHNIWSRPDAWSGKLTHDPNAATSAPALIEYRPAADRGVPLPAVQGPRRAVRSTNRHFFGVFDEQENKLYLLELDHVRTRIHAVGRDL